MKNRSPLVVEAIRGSRIESRHLVDAVIADASGKLVRVYGECKRPVFPRSAIKALQALALVESGAADRFGLKPRHIALACSSHNGEPMHVKTAGEMLARAGLEPACLECGVQWPSLRRDQARLVRAGKQAEALHNNCSGKHSGFLCFAANAGIETRGYVKLAHPVQKTLAGILHETTGARHSKANHGIDGCSIPTYAIPLQNLAIGFARFGVAEAPGKQRSKAMTRIRDACFAHPEMVGGTDRFDTRMMQALKGRAFTKTGAEGVFVAALPQLGFGIAVKAHDGASRAAEIAVARLIESLLELDQAEANALRRLVNPQLKNWNRIHVGELR